MTTRINIQPVPNQSLSIALDDRQYNIAIKEINGSMAVDIERDNQIVIQGHRVAAGTPLIPYRYLESGNFIFTTRNGEQPYYTKFAESQALIYARPDELEAFRASPVTPTFPTPEVMVRPIFYAPLTDDLRYTGAGVITFARNSIATGVRNGVLSQVAVNTPRFEDEGLLIEGESQNELANSGSGLGVRGWAVNAPIISRDSDNAIAPDGTMTATRIITGRSGGGVFRGGELEENTTQTVSVWMRGEAGGERVRIGSGSGAINETYQSVTLTNEWVRYSFTIDASFLESSRSIAIYQLGSSTRIVFFVWGYQVEEQNFLSSYIPTTGTALARPADVLTLPTGISQTGDATVFIVVRENGSSESFPDIWRVLLGRGTRLEARGSAPIGRVLFHALPNIAIILTTDSFNTHVYAISRSGMTYRAYTDGVFINQMTTDTAVTPQTPVIGGSDGFFGNVRDLAVYDRTLSDVEIMRISRQMLERTFSG